MKHMGRKLAVWLFILTLALSACGQAEPSSVSSSGAATLPIPLMPSASENNPQDTSVPSPGTDESSHNASEGSSSSSDETSVPDAQPDSASAPSDPASSAVTPSSPTAGSPWRPWIDLSSVEDLSAEIPNYDYSPYLPLPNLDRWSASAEFLQNNGGIGRMDSSQPVIYLCFSLASELGDTEPLLNLLKEKDVPATFFISIYDYLYNYDHGYDTAALVRRMGAEGHTLGSHGYAHTHSTLATNRQFFNELIYAQAAFSQLLGYDYPLTYFSPPYETMIERDIYCCDLLGIRFVRFTYLLDDEVGKAPAYDVYPQLMGFLQNGVIIQMHVGAGNTEALDHFIENARKEGYEFRALPNR